MSSFGYLYEAVNIKLPQDVAASCWWFNVRRKGYAPLELVYTDRALASLGFRYPASLRVVLWRLGVKVWCLQ